ncbi:hypothetical protein IU418_26530 [Nocardia farcinica]|uniref:DUF6221 family protein n=1 Tax=Nocardia farcinica TaxID=37329 RepID=UPI0009CF8DD0|nr:DUF6221 family protein [Nocardia farcinica]MBF6540768.1 hypothetical protein [Nocardia farcinica]SLG32841.1 Uncharacterised protein [Mycobacteroides abscessus subsp. abscessus]
MSNIVTFIEARLAEDEAAARKAADFPYDAPSDAPWVSMQLRVRRGVAMTSDEHFARHDPARVLRQAGVLRALVAGHDRDEWFEFDDETTGSCKACSSYCPECRSLVRWPCGTLRMVAGVWRNHPDYRPEWALDPRAAETETGDPE